MKDELLNFIKLPFTIFGWLIRSLLRAFVLLTLIIAILIWKDKISTTVRQAFVGPSSYSGSVTTQRTITTHPDTDYILHTFEQGDTFANLAQRYNVAAEVIASLNNITRFNPVKYGQILYIPQYQERTRPVQTRHASKNAITFL